MFLKCFFVKENVKKEYVLKLFILCYKIIYSVICFGKNKIFYYFVCMYLVCFRNCLYVIVFIVLNYK